MNKKLIISLGVAVFIAIISIITNFIDSGRVTTGHEPKFCLKIVSNDNKTITYWGLGYKVIRYVGVSPNEPYKNNIGVKMGSWFMKYELPIDSNNEQKLNIENINDFYNLKLTKDKNINNLGKNYSIDDAIKDGYFVITNTKVYNDDTYTLFMDNYNNKKTSFMRIVKSTIEEDIIINDVIYFENNNKLYLVTDNTRDEFAALDNRNIAMKEYNYLENYNYQGREYLILFNEEVTDELFEDGKVFILSNIN